MKKNEINKVHIHNDINRINTQNLKELDINVFFSICAIFKNSNELSVKIPFDTFMDLTKVEKKTLNTRKKFIDFADKKTKKFRKLEYYNKTDSSLRIFNLIEGIEVPENEDVIEISITRKFSEMLHDYNGNFTEFFLQTIVEIKGKYAKNLYHLLMQWSNTGFATFPAEEFKGCMGVTDGYRPKDIKEKVIEPAIQILLEKKLFEEISYEVIKNRRQGNQITGYSFYFREAANDEMPGQNKFQIQEGNELTYQGQKNHKKQFAAIEESPSNPKNKKEWDDFEKMFVDN